ncbi:MAG: type II toxin-antitoxin system VapB family antitoxin [Nitrococcus sp.]|nr:type II toxin-antitoxin system VapB family antitoxin [Nitrococcus sp.]
MNLQIRDPRARELAKQLADEKQVAMTEAVIDALEAELRRQRNGKPLAERVRPIIERLKSKAKPDGRDLTKDEIDAIWGHE